MFGGEWKGYPLSEKCSRVNRINGNLNHNPLGLSYYLQISQKHALPGSMPCLVLKNVFWTGHLEYIDYFHVPSLPNHSFPKLIFIFIHTWGYMTWLKIFPVSFKMTYSGFHTFIFHQHDITRPSICTAIVLEINTAANCLSSPAVWFDGRCLTKFPGGTQFIEKNQVLRFILAFSWIASLNLTLRTKKPKEL